MNMKKIWLILFLIVIVTGIIFSQNLQNRTTYEVLLSYEFLNNKLEWEQQSVPKQVVATSTEEAIREAIRLFKNDWGQRVKNVTGRVIKVFSGEG